MDDYLERFRLGEPTTDLADDLMARGAEVRSCDLQFLRFGGQDRFAGPVRTLKCSDDNVLLKEIVSSPGHGAVLVVDGGGSLHTALCGDIVAGIAVENGWSGLVINGAVRDQLALAGLPIGLKALGTNPRRSNKEGLGDVDVPIEIGGVTFTTSDVVLSDVDGILAVEVIG